MSVAVTSDRADLLALCEKAGLAAVHLPCIAVSPIEEGVAVARRLGREANRIVITSIRVPALLWPEGMPPAPCSAVGPRTAVAVTDGGGRVDHVGDGGAEALLATLPPGDGMTLYPHAAAADPTVLAGAASAGIECVAVYATEPVAPADTPVDAVLFASPSAVEGWGRSRSLDGLAVGAIGATTANRLRALGREPDVIASTPTFADLLATMKRHLLHEGSLR